MSSLQRKSKSRNTDVSTIEKLYENVNKVNKEDIIATTEVIEKKLKKLCRLKELRNHVGKLLLCQPQQPAHK